MRKNNKKKKSRYQNGFFWTISYKQEPKYGHEPKASK
jgi:hypothetical protein